MHVLYSWNIQHLPTTNNSGCFGSMVVGSWKIRVYGSLMSLPRTIPTQVRVQDPPIWKGPLSFRATSFQQPHTPRKQSLTSSRGETKNKTKTPSHVNPSRSDGSIMIKCRSPWIYDLRIARSHHANQHGTVHDGHLGPGRVLRCRQNDQTVEKNISISPFLHGGGVKLNTRTPEK